MSSYCQLKEEALDRTTWRIRFGRGFGPVVWQITDDDDMSSTDLSSTDLPIHCGPYGTNHIKFSLIAVDSHMLYIH